MATQEDAHQREDQLDDVLDDVLGSVAHELTTPLVSARALAGLLPDLIEADPDGEVADVVASIRRNLQYALLLVERLGDVRGIDERAMRASARPVDLVPIAEEAVEDLRPVILANHPARVEAGQRPVLVLADAGRVRQVLFNLLSNAARYSDPGMEVVVTVTQEDAHGIIVVRNHGLGVAPEDAERIFQKYVRVEDRADTSGGAGLGLYLSRRIARGLGGDLTTRPAPDGNGSQFVLRLPLADS